MDKRVSGFTIVELMVTVTIVAILLAVAIPSYRGFTLRSTRVAATSELARIAQIQERFFFDNRAFGDLSDLGFAADTIGVDESGNPVAAGAGVYDLSIVLPNPPQTYTAQAVATNNQTNDAGCLTLTIVSTGLLTPTDCW